LESTRLATALAWPRGRTEGQMALMQLAKPRWQTYFDHLAAAQRATRAEIDVTGLGLGHQIETDWTPLIGLSYDPKGDVLAVIAEGVEHLIRHPKQIHIDQELDWVSSIEVIDAEGTHHIVVFKESLRLPTP
jgi:hypothetical protein